MENPFDIDTRARGLMRQMKISYDEARAEVAAFISAELRSLDDYTSEPQILVEKVRHPSQIAHRCVDCGALSYWTPNRLANHCKPRCPKCSSTFLEPCGKTAKAHKKIVLGVRHAVGKKI